MNDLIGPRDVACPFCGVGPQRPCRTYQGNITSHSHTDRVRAFNQPKDQPMTTRWPAINRPYRCAGVPATFHVDFDHTVKLRWDDNVIVRGLEGTTHSYDDHALGRIKLGIDIGMVAVSYDADRVADFIAWVLPNTALTSLIEHWQDLIYKGQRCPSCHAMWDNHSLNHHPLCEYIDGLDRAAWDDLEWDEPSDDETAEDIATLTAVDHDERVARATTEVINEHAETLRRLGTEQA